MTLTFIIPLLLFLAFIEFEAWNDALYHRERRPDAPGRWHLPSSFARGCMIVLTAYAMTGLVVSLKAFALALVLSAVYWIIFDLRLDDTGTASPGITSAAWTGSTSSCAASKVGACPGT